MFGNGITNKNCMNKEIMKLKLSSAVYHAVQNFFLPFAVQVCKD